MSSEEEIVFVRKKKVIFNNSSDDNEVVDQQETKLQDSLSNHNANLATDLHGTIPDKKEKKLRKKQRRITTLDSSSDSEQDNNSSNDSNNQKTTGTKQTTTLDSSLESEQDNNHSNDSSKQKTTKAKQKKYLKRKENSLLFQKTNELLNYKSSSSDENEEIGSRLRNLEPQKNDKSPSLGSKIVHKNLWYNNSDLYDAEGSSEDEDKRREEPEVVIENDANSLSDKETTFTNSSKQKQPMKHKKREERKSKTKAKEDIKTDIYKESQRLLRQVPISIPYHRPKQRTLAEFLVRRKSTPKVPLKSSSDQLYKALKELERREKEAELFFMSDSSEDEYRNEKEGKKCDVFKTNCDGEKGENNSGNNAGGEVNTEKSIVSHDMEEITLHFEGTNSVVSLKHQEDHLIKVGDSNNDTSYSKSNETGQYAQESSDETEAVIFQRNVSSESDKETEYEERQIDNQTKVVKSNSTIELKSPDNEIDSVSNEILSSESVQTNTEQKMEVSESTISNLDTMIAQPKPDKQSQDDIDASSLCDVDKKVSNTSTSCGIINTEEFSLKLSESQSEGISFEDLTVKNSLDHSNISTNADKAEDKSITKHSSVMGELKELEDQDSNTSNFNFETNKTQNEENETNKLLVKENYVENELYKKYNVELKKNNISAPKIIGSNNQVIDLDEGVQKSEVHDLMKRFLTHLSYKKKPKKKVPVELSIVSAERDGEGNVNGISEESVQVLVGEDEEEDPSLARPGAKMARLRAQLQQQIEKQRDQQWAKKQQDEKLYEDEEFFEGEKDICGANEDETEKTGNDEDKDETEEAAEEEEEDEDDGSESLDNETDEELAEKSRKSRSVFLDDEAEESEEEVYTKISRKRKNSCYDANKDLSDDSDGSVIDVDCNNKEKTISTTKKIKDINLEEISDTKGSPVISDFFLKRTFNKKPALPRTRTASDMFLSEEADEDELPSFQKPRSSDDKEDVEEKLSETPSFTSPGFQLTALENMDCTKYNWSAPSTPCKEFLTPKLITPVRAIPGLVDKSPQVCTQDLENMCSGNFSSQPLQEDEENNQDFDLFLAEDSQLTRDQVTPLKHGETGKSYSNRKIDASLADEDEELESKVTSKKAKKLIFSDDEDNCDNNQEGESEEEEVDRYKHGSLEECAGDEEVEYDSEENEVEVAKTAGQFLDVEAELSEEEWSSEDEDERGLDILEMEEADKEKIDQRRLKQQLDQIHMKEMLKEDKKQVKLLQEMLLEDGELHSDNKRQRLFRWSNNVAFGEGDNKAQLDSDEEKAEEDEDEENWRKSRHERELFLQEHKKKVEKTESLELEDSDSQLLRLGQKALRRLGSNSQEPRLTPPTLSNPLASPDAKKPFLLPKRGSFLSRGAQALSRLAQMVSSTSDGPIQQPKNSRNFVFTSISPTKGEQAESKPELVPNKRKKPHLPLPIAKKACIKKPKTVNEKSLFEALTRVHSL